MNIDDLLTYPNGTVLIVTNVSDIQYGEEIRKKLQGKHQIINEPIFGDIKDVDPEGVAYDYGFIGTVKVWKNEKSILIYGIIEK